MSETPESLIIKSSYLVLLVLMLLRYLHNLDIRPDHSLQSLTRMSTKGDKQDSDSSCPKMKPAGKPMIKVLPMVLPAEAALFSKRWGLRSKKHNEQGRKGSGFVPTRFWHNLVQQHGKWRVLLGLTNLAMATTFFSVLINIGLGRIEM